VLGEPWQHDLERVSLGKVGVGDVERGAEALVSERAIQGRCSNSARFTAMTCMIGKMPVFW
jgi:hypothetical protein